MANPGVGSKFVSVNLNKSYGQPSNSYGGNRQRSGSRGVGGGMVVLSRHQSSIMGVQKTGPKLSVPPPMNLPSLRKEHEGFDSSASVSGAVGSGNIGSGPRPTSSGMGWSKLAPPASQEKDAGDDHHAKLVGDRQIVNDSNDLSSYSSSDATSGRASGSVYIPPSARSGTLGAPIVHSSRPSPVVDKAMVLKGEDFPSLQATLSSTSGVTQKQHNVSQHRQKQRVTEEAFDQQKDSSYSGTSNHMHPQVQSSRPSRSSDESPVGGSGLSSSNTVEKSRKPDTYFPGPLRLAQLKHTSDWADDERDTGHGISDRERDQNTRERDCGYSRNESFWGNDFDFPRVGVMPRASVPNLSEGRGMLDGEGEKVPMMKFARGSTSNRDVRTSSGRGGGYNARDRYSIDQSDRYRGDFFPKSLVPKTSFSLGTRGPAVNDPVFNFVKEKRSSNVKQYLEDPFLKDIISGPGLDGRDPITGGLVGVFKRKKDTSKQADFHDPVRESFEAELERVQKMQEQERQQILDEQTRAVELARKEEEDRERFAREVIERRRRLEEEAREVAWRAEQERLEAIRRAEEQKTAREEEKRRMHMEEERRKEAARKKLLELEARIARRQSEAKDDKFSIGAAVRDDKMFGLAMERDGSMATDVVDWEDGERMVERITNSASSDYSNLTRSVDMGSRPPYTRGGDLVFSDREKPGNAWRRDVFEHGNSSSFMLHDQDNDNRGPRRDTFGAGRASRKDLYDSSGVVSGTRSSSKGGFSEPHQLDDFPHLRGHKWNFGGEVDHYSRNSEIDAEYYDNTTDKFGDIGWGLGRPSGSLHSPYPERLYQNFEADGFFSYSRSRHSVRQPRVPPPPSLASIHKNIRGDMENPNSSAPLDNELRYHHPSTENEASQTNVQSETILQEQKIEKAISSRCDSQSSLCVSSPPHSPIHLSDDDLEDSGDSPVLKTAAKGEEFSLSKSEHDFSAAVDRNTNNSENVSPAEDEEWAIESDEELQEQEEYDEDDGYLKEDEVQEGDDEELANGFLSSPIVHLEEEEGPSGESGGEVVEPDNASAVLDDAKKQILETGRLFVSNLPYTASEEDLAEIFGKFGDISEVHLVVDRDTNRSKGIAYVLYKLPEFAVRAFEELDNSMFQGRILHILPAKQQSTVRDASLYLERAPGSILSPSSSSEADAQKYGVVGENNVKRAIIEQGVEAISDPDRVESRSLFVKNLNFSTSDENLKKHFTEKMKEGRIQSAKVKQHMENGKNVSMGFGSIELDSVETATKVCRELQGTILDGHALILQHCNSFALVQSMMPAVSSGVSRGEVPMNLQFGLFSGPSLIPSPVPAIQVGSIQMPVHIHPQVGSSVTHMHPSQPPFFQFGQLRYASPMSQGILPLAPQSVSFVQPPVPTHYSFNQNQESAVNIPASQVFKIYQPESSVMFNDQPGVPKLSNIFQDSKPREATVLAGRQDQENEVLTSHSQAHNSILPNSQSRSKSLVQDQRQHDMAVKNNSRYAANSNESQGRVQAESTKSQFVPRDLGPISNARGKRFIYTVKNSGSRPSFPVSEAPHSDFNGFHKRPHQKFQRTEFRVRENVEKRHTESAGSSENFGMDERLNFDGRMSGYSVRNGVVKKEFGYNRQSKHLVESAGLNSDSSGSRVADSESKTEKQPGKEATAKRLTSSLNLSESDSGEGNPKRNSSLVEDVDAPMQSGIVRIFRQTGIEAPSDEDDFIEVRSKRQMLIDRRKQREREIKAKSRIAKASRKPCYVSQNPRAPVYSNKPSTPLVAEAASSVPSTSLVSDGKATSHVEVVPAFKNAIASQPLAPIGTPAHNSDGNAVTRAHSIKPLRNNSVPGISNNGTNLAPGSSLANKSVAMPAFLGSWGSARINQQVMTLTQTQLDDAMKTARFDSHVPCISGLTTAAIDRSKPSSSILPQDKSFSSTASPLSSLLAGEKIQFGAVTSPTILASSSRAISSDLGPPDSSRPDASVDHTLSAVASDRSFFEKEQCPDKSCARLDDPEAEAEAEAAASAVAVAAISSDEIVGASPVSTSDTQGFGDGDMGSLASGGGSGNHQSTSQPRGEESLSVALPADLSVETTSLSLWPPLPSPQNTSSQMLSHFPGAPPHFPCYEMNPMLGAQIFAFSPHDESASTYSQSQKSSMSGGPLGGWQPCPSGVDPFYGPSAGFTGPFISPSGGIPGVQGPPHMVVYNHFTPVGQFGQVGLSCMGATYIPSGKQPDWKHHPITLTTGTSEGDMNNLNIVSAQRNPSSTPTPIQHLAPVSPLLPLGSPFAMFDMSQFQPPTDVPVQARWSHVPASHLHSVPLSVPLQQGEGGLPQFSHGLCMDQSVVNRFHDACSVAPPQDTHRNFPVSNSATIAAQFPDELGLVDPAISTGSHVLNGSRTTVFSSSNTSFCSTNSNSKIHNTVSKNSSRNNAGNNGVDGGVHNSSNNQSMNSAHKNQSSTHHHQNSTHQLYLHPTSGYSNLDQREKVSSSTGSGGEWSHRRMGGFQGRNQSSRVDNKNYTDLKTKQIYVAKTTTSGTSGMSTQD